MGKLRHSNCLALRGDLGFSWDVLYSFHGKLVAVVVDRVDMM